MIVALMMIRRSELRPSMVIPRGRGQIRDGFRYALRVREVRFPLVAMAVVGTISLNSQVVGPLARPHHVPLRPRSVRRVRRGRCVRCARRLARGGARDPLHRLAHRQPPRSRSASCTPSSRSHRGRGWRWSVSRSSFFWASIYIAWSNARLQQVTDDAYRGRVMALYSIVFLGSTPIGSIIVSGIAEVTNPRSLCSLTICAA